MKEVSNYLLNFVKKDLKVLPQSNPFSKKSKTFLQQLIQTALAGEQEWNRVQSNKGTDLDQIPVGKNYHWITPDFKEIIHGSPSISKKYVFSVYSRTLTVFFVLPVHPKKPPSSEKVEAYFQTQLKRIFIWFCIVNAYAPESCSKQIDLYLYLTNSVKFLPTKTEVIDTKHANTGFTTSCQLSTEINIYREEEWFKVLLHESFHNMGLDFSGMREQYTKQQILNVFSVESDVNLFETYCEIGGEMMNMLFYIMFSKGFTWCSENPEKVIKKMEEIVKYEKTYSLFQSVKVLHHFEINYQDILYKPIKSNKYKEKTNVLSYYVLKSIGIFFLNDFIEWIVVHNRGSLAFEKTNENLKQYCDFFIVRCNNPVYLANMEQIERWFSKNAKKKEKTLEMKTMKMVLFDF